jgi:hypothetical protein
MVYNALNYWGFGLGPSSGILKNTKEHNVSGTWSVSVLRWGVGDTLLGSSERANLRDPVSPTASSEDGNRPSSRNVVFFRIPDDVLSPKTQ